MTVLKFKFKPQPRIILHGYSPEDPQSILKQLENGSLPSSFKGDFILIAEGTDQETNKPLAVILSTVIAAVPYYYYSTPSRFIHSSSVQGICSEAGLQWRWNWDSLAQLALFDQVLGDNSVHQDINRVPSASVMMILDNKLETLTESFWDEVFDLQKPNTSVELAHEVLLEILSESPAGRVHALSLSAGYDSRLLLACVKYLKRDIVTSTMGSEESTDVKVAKELAKLMDCEFQRVNIDAEDYVTYSTEILESTNCEKMFWHWHTGIYTKKLNFDPSILHLAGSNGEFVRSYYFDKGLLARALDITGIPMWGHWLSLKNSAWRRLPKQLRQAFETQSEFFSRLNSAHLMKGMNSDKFRFGDGLDRFYAKVRVRNFIGLGLALYRSSYTTMSPFLDARFIRYAARLPRQNKLANCMHRTVIQKLAPALMHFPVDESGRTIASPPGNLYFLQKAPMKGYDRTAEAQQLPKVANWARRGFLELGGNPAMLEEKSNLFEIIRKWNLAISVGAYIELLSNGSKMISARHKV